MQDEKNHANENAAPHRRRQYIVNPAFQWKYVATGAVAVFMVACVISLVQFTMLHQQARMRAMNPTTYTADVGTAVLCFAGAFALLTAGAVGLWSVVLTHRVCGPLFMMERHLVELSKGRIPTMRPLRRKDEFKDFHATLNRTFATLKTNKERELEAATKALSNVTSAINTNDATRKDALCSVARNLESLCNAAREALGDVERATLDTPETPAAITSPSTVGV